MPGTQGRGMAERGEMAKQYAAGASLAEIAAAWGLTVSLVRRRILSTGLPMRSTAEAMVVGGPKTGRALSGRRRPPRSREWCEAIVRGRGGDPAALGVRPNWQSYLVFTRGPHAKRRLHDVLMEEHIGRRLLSNEVVHHIDGNKTNNDLSNLRLMDTREHARLHAAEKRQRREQMKMGEPT